MARQREVRKQLEEKLATAQDELAQLRLKLADADAAVRACEDRIDALRDMLALLAPTRRKKGE